MISLSEKILKILQENDDEECSSDNELYPLECHFCAATFFISSEYYEHVRSHLDEGKNNKSVEKTHQCSHDGCEKAFLRVSDLKKHQVEFCLAF